MRLLSTLSSMQLSGFGRGSGVSMGSMLNKEKKNQNIPTENCHFYSYILKSGYCIGVLS